MDKKQDNELIDLALEGQLQAFTILMEVFVKRVEWQGNPALLSIGTDISTRKRIEDELQRNEGLVP